MIDVCLCTHNPRPEIFTKVLASILDQTAGADTFCFLIVDNASSPPLDESLLGQFTKQGIMARMVREPTPGLQHARLAALRNTSSDWVLWVDDDNELFPDYIQNGVDFIKQHSEVGCFGGKLILQTDKRYGKWLIPFLPYLGIKDAGNTLLIEKADYWTQAEPPGAGAWVHRKVLNVYRRESETEDAFFELGRIGTRGLASCDDSMMMRGAFRCGLACAYLPSLQLYHHIDIKKRFNFSYLVRLMHAYGVSHVVLESVLNGKQPIPDYYSSNKQFLRLLLSLTIGRENQSLAFGVGMMAYHLGARSEHFRQSMVK